MLVVLDDGIKETEHYPGPSLSIYILDADQYISDREFIAKGGFSHTSQKQ